MVDEPILVHEMRELVEIARKRRPDVDLSRVRARCVRCGASLTAIGIMHFEYCDFRGERDIAFFFV